MLDTWCFSTFRLKMPHMCSVGFRSGDVLGHSITFSFSFISKAVVILAVCLGSLLCWKTAVRHSFWREDIMFWFRMSPYMLDSMVPSMNRSSPVPAALMQPQTMMLPPPCLIVGKAQFSWYSSPGHRHTCWTPSESNKFILDSSDHRTCSWPGCLQQTAGFLWASFRRGFLLGRRPCKPTCCSVWRMVWALTSWPSTSATSKAMLAALIRLFFEASFCIWRTAQGLNFFDRPLRGLFRVKPVLENLCMTLATVL